MWLHLLISDEFLVVAPPIATDISGFNFGPDNFVVLCCCQLFDTNTSLLF